MTFEELIKRALEKVPNDMDKREGSPIYLALAPACFELAEAYMELEAIRNMTYADTSIGEDLTRRCAERAIYRRPATYALRKGVLNTNVPLGTRFRLDETTYSVTKELESNTYELQCEQPGAIGNAYVGALLPITYIKGLMSAELTDILVPGEEVEEDESLRKRYFESLESEAYGGNVADYKNKTKAIDGVGGVKVYPVWNGGGTVKLVIVDTEYNKPNPTLIEKVQTLIDPVQNQGEGRGIAPIGHVVTVEGVKETSITIASQITLQEGYEWRDVEEGIKKAIRDYFKELCKTWEEVEGIVVRISYIETRILGVTGVLDIQNTLLNEQGQNLVLEVNNIPVLGGIMQS
ncbi:baseplate J/gp47 family protein [Zhenhengia yiwuensis]|uniref:baseplate J/gp47 family protein n=1 Tax=Zhenhengia yiwuensis TaxID=2763666 RepID=UPI002A7619D6|nr:baseplate J/gp47 family protein [Zhenhengia yiwuensis]MDY3366511.1 baseplate J/gp47 family protein [Zhenhengia yiwuensis]